MLIYLIWPYIHPPSHSAKVARSAQKQSNKIQLINAAWKLEHSRLWHAERSRLVKEGRPDDDAKQAAAEVCARAKVAFYAKHGA